MAPRMCSFFLLLTALCLASPAAGGEPRRFPGVPACVFPLVNRSPSTGGEELQKPVTDAVQQEFESAGFRAVSTERWRRAAGTLSLRPGDLVDGPSAVAVARAADATLAVNGFYAVQGDRILVSVQCYDAQAGTLSAGFLRTWRLNIGFYNSLHAEIAALLERVSFSDAPRLAALAEDVRVPEISFTCPLEGMEVLLEGESAGRITDGVLRYEAGGLKAGLPLRVEKRLEGYHTSWETVVASPRTPLAPLRREHTRVWEAGWTLGQSVGAGGRVRLFPVPDWFTIGLSDSLYAQAPLSPNAAWVVHNDAEITVGQYLFFPPESGFRLGVGAGIGVIISQVLRASSPPYGDAYLNMFSPWCEWRFGEVSLILRVDVKYALGTADGALSRGIMLWGGFFPPVTLGVSFPW